MKIQNKGEDGVILHLRIDEMQKIVDYEKNMSVIETIARVLLEKLEELE